MLGPDRIREALDPAFAVAADGMLATVHHATGGLTRFAASQIHQNIWREQLSVQVLAVADGARVGIAETSSLAPDDVRRAAEDALALARVTPRNPDFPGLAPPAAYQPAAVFDEPTAGADPAERARIVAGTLADLPADAEGAGYVETVARELSLASTTGMRAYATSTQAGFSFLAMTGSSSGFAEVVERRLGAIDPSLLAERAIRKAERGRDPQPIDPGTYPVVLEPAATSTLLQFLGWLGLGARAYLENRSFLSGRLGRQVLHPSITIVDDPTSPGALGLPFDFEGTPAQTITLIDRGVARDVAWDRTWARKAGRTSTGHALPAPNPDGPLPLNLRLEPGRASLDELIASTERGLLVTRFHYANVVNEKETVLTGMTRDGTFLIRDGAVGPAVRNLRFTQNAVEALCDVEGLGDTTEISTELFFGGSRAPAVKIGRFAFSSATTH